jgi:endonuclease G
VAGLPADQVTLTLATAEPGDLLGREVAVVGYPALDTRNDLQIQNTVFRGLFNVKRLQPGKVGEPAGIRSFGRQVMSLTHDCSTLGGNSGSAVVDVQHGTVLALHFAGSYLVANYAVPAHALASDRRVVDAGVLFDQDVHPPATVEWEDFWTLADPAPARSRGGDELSGLAAAATTPNGLGAARSPASEHSVVIEVPLEITVRVATPAAVTTSATAGATTSVTAAAPVGIEAVEPFHEEDLQDRDGYDDMFLGVPLPLPKVNAGIPVSRLDDGSIELHYEHFTAVMNSRRRMAHFLAANVDGRTARTRPEPGRDYSREGLGGLASGDREKWFTDPRIPADHQLPDRFFNRDRGSFDKGHIIRRTYVAWGDGYDQVRRANGDTYHVTNCSPQVAAFNQSLRHGLWGELENLVQQQAKAETYTVFAGPAFRDDDPDFEGRDDRGRTIVQIPRSFWKVIVARTPNAVQTFAFELAQDMSNVDFTELAFDATWRTRMVGVRDLEATIGTLRFPDILVDTDQHATGLEGLREPTPI